MPTWHAAEELAEQDDGTPALAPVRALALEQGRLELAEHAYREDLERNPENGWALHGLAECLRQRGAAEEAEAVERRFTVSWTHADTPLDHGSCFCRGRVAELRAVRRAGEPSARPR